ncbi:magnesium transporter [Mycoplasmopsis felis]|nr:magnesium transporter [Mycoplasmopsis felis]
MISCYICKILRNNYSFISTIKFKKDPAVMSAPILATLSDALATLIFFGLNLLVLYLAYISE